MLGVVPAAPPASTITRCLQGKGPYKPDNALAANDPNLNKCGSYPSQWYYGGPIIFILEDACLVWRIRPSTTWCCWLLESFESTPQEEGLLKMYDSVAEEAMHAQLLARRRHLGDRASTFPYLLQLPLMFGQVACMLIIQINGDGFDLCLEGMHCA